jgi:hypothetical protein
MTTSADELRQEVRQRYAQSARAITEKIQQGTLHGGPCCSDADVDEERFVSAVRR